MPVRKLPLPVYANVSCFFLSSRGSPSNVAGIVKCEIRQLRKKLENRRARLSFTKRKQQKLQSLNIARCKQAAQSERSLPKNNRHVNNKSPLNQRQVKY